MTFTRPNEILLYRVHVVHMLKVRLAKKAIRIHICMLLAIYPIVQKGICSWHQGIIALPHPTRDANAGATNE